MKSVSKITSLKWGGGDEVIIRNLTLTQKIELEGFVKAKFFPYVNDESNYEIPY